MKKIFTLFLAMVVTLSMFAVTPNPFGKKADPIGCATELAHKQLKHHKQVAKALGLDKFEGKTTPRTAPNAKKSTSKGTKRGDNPQL